MNYLKKLCTLAVLFPLIACSDDGLESDPSERANSDPESEPASQAFQSDPSALVDYSWEILDSLRADNSQCRNERCFREGDSILILNHGEDNSQHCDRDLTLVMNDASSGHIKPFYGFNGVISGCNQEAAPPVAVSMNFWDPDKNDEVCRQIVITPVRMSDSDTEEQCETKLRSLSNLDEPAFDLLLSRSCDLLPLIHWRVSDADRAECEGSDTVMILAPPEPGQGTGSGGTD